MMKILYGIILLVIIFAIGVIGASAQSITGNEFQTGQTGKAVVGTVNMCINGSNIAMPCSGGTPLAVSGSFAAPSVSNLATTQVSVSSTATQVLPARVGRQAAVIENTAATAVYCGGPSVTTTTGMLLPGVVGSSLSIPTGAAIYCVTATGTNTVSAMETY
jgi:hypothetical protein